LIDLLETRANKTNVDWVAREMGIIMRIRIYKNERGVFEFMVNRFTDYFVKYKSFYSVSNVVSLLLNF